MAVGTLLPGLSTLEKWSRVGTFGTRHELDRYLKNDRTQLQTEIRLNLRGKIQSIVYMLLESSYNFMMMLLNYTDTEIRILLCQGFSEKNILSLLSDQLRQIFDGLYWYCIMGREKLVSSTLDKTATIMWATLHNHEVMADFSKHEIKSHPSITYIFVRFFINAKIFEPLQDISRTNKDIKVLSTNSVCHHGRLDNPEE